MEKDSIKVKLISAFAAAVIIHGVVEKIIFLDQVDHPSDFGGCYQIRNITGTAITVPILPALVEIDNFDF